MNSELSRYAFSDAYTVAELQAEYQSRDAKGRIQLLQEFYEADRFPPMEIAVLAVKDEGIEVRRWIARNGKYLDYRKAGFVHERSDTAEQLMQMADEFSDKSRSLPILNLADWLKNDPESLVRAALRENPSVFTMWANGERWKEFFKEAGHIERLGLVRNPAVRTTLIEKIFDFEDQELGIDCEQRTELACAFLTNTQAISRQEKNLDDMQFIEAEAFFKKLWTSASKWPKDSGIPYLIYRYVPYSGNAMKEGYESCDDPHIRRVILEYSKPTQFAKYDPRLGLNDPDGYCRNIAYSKVGRLTSQEFDLVLKGDDMDALEGLAMNRWFDVQALPGLHTSSPLNPEEISEWLIENGYARWDLSQRERTTLFCLNKIAVRCRELCEIAVAADFVNYSGAEQAEENAKRTMREIKEDFKKTRTPKDPKDLFESAGREGDFLPNKLDFIGKTLLRSEVDIENISAELRRTEAFSLFTLATMILIGFVLIIFRWLG